MLRINTRDRVTLLGWLECDLERNESPKREPIRCPESDWFFLDERPVDRRSERIRQTERRASRRIKTLVAYGRDPFLPIMLEGLA